MGPSSSDTWHGTTILIVRKGGKVVIAGDGQVTLGQTIIKGNAKKVRRVGNGNVGAFNGLFLAAAAWSAWRGAPANREAGP